MKKFLIVFLIYLQSNFPKFIDAGGVFPPTSPTRHQFVAGIGVPLQLKEEAITLGYLLKAQYFLANDVQQLKLQFFPDIFANNTPNFLWNMKWTKFPDAARRSRREIQTDLLTGQNFESYQVNVEQIGDEPLNDEKSVNWMTNKDEEFDDKFDDDIEDEEMFLKENYENQIQNENDEEFHLPRWTIYDAIGKYLTAKGFNGRECVLKSICEAQRTPFGDNLFEELFQIFFTPSKTDEEFTSPSDIDYMKAQEHGENFEGDDCSEIYRKCEKSLLEIISEIENNDFYKFN